MKFFRFEATTDPFGRTILDQLLVWHFTRGDLLASLSTSLPRSLLDSNPFTYLTVDWSQPLLFGTSINKTLASHRVEHGWSGPVQWSCKQFLLLQTAAKLIQFWQIYLKLHFLWLRKEQFVVSYPNIHDIVSLKAFQVIANDFKRYYDIAAVIVCGLPLSGLTRGPAG